MKTYKMCSRCVMDTTDSNIVFDKDGVCNHCHSYDETMKWMLPSFQKVDFLEEKIKKIKQEQGKYNCLIGLSGGMDSSYVVYLAYLNNLRPLIIHLDNGWDSPLAIKNVENIIHHTGFDYINYKIDEKEFIEIQRAYFTSNVVDVEVPTDLAIISIMNKYAVKYKIKYILSGLNIVTELTMGTNWNYSKTDRSNFNSIISKFCQTKIKTYPYYSPYEQFKFKISNIKNINILECIDIDIKKMGNDLHVNFDWQNYDVKHGESIFTKFYQFYYLPIKFGIDKRKAHFSDLIRSHNMEREDALEELKRLPYISEDEKAEILMRLGYTNEEFNVILQAKPISHYFYGNNQLYGSFIDRIFLLLLKSSYLIRILRYIYRIIEK